MSSRVTVNGKSYHRDPHAPLRQPHRPIIEHDAARFVGSGLMHRCDMCALWCFAVAGPSGAYWRHQPDTFWTSR